ncbi:MAG: ABC transporter substrate-binding protein [Nocardioides sp.]|nr:ABC transporter substrate-binding protein [Nocardioides sp.]
MRLPSLARAAVLVLPLAIAAAACAPTEESTTAGADTSDTSSAESSAPASTNGSAAADECAPESLPLRTDGTLTVGTDSPAFEPWFVDDDPTNGKGFESAVAYEVAERLGFSADQVTWVTVPFNTSYAPGAKTFDFDINQISITPARAEVVDFSQGYYSAAQGVIALGDNPVAEAASVADLADYTLGAQTGTTSLTAIRETIAPSTEPRVFEDTNAAKQALLNGQVDAIVADLPTAFFITAVEIPRASIIGQFEAEAGQEEEFGMLFEKDSALVSCVDAALGEMTDDGALDALEQEWLSETVDVPQLP